MLDFMEAPRLPDCYSFDAASGPAFSTTVAPLAGGHESRNQNWEQERLAMDLSYQNRTQAERDELSAFFRLARGRTRGFRVKDWGDYQATQQQGQVIINPLTGDAEMFKLYDLAGEQYVRRIHKPIDGTILFFSGAVQTPATFDPTTGIVTTGTITGWSGEFDVPMRFDQDILQWSIVEKTNAGDLIYTTNNLQLVQIRAGFV